MAQATYSIRMDADTKKNFDMICASFGMNASTAFTIFAKQVIKEKKIPFEISSPDFITESESKFAMDCLRSMSEEKGLDKMTMDEIDEEIRQSRKDRGAYEEHTS